MNTLNAYGVLLLIAGLVYITRWVLRVFISKIFVTNSLSTTTTLSENTIACDKNNQAIAPNPHTVEETAGRYPADAQDLPCTHRVSTILAIHEAAMCQYTESISPSVSRPSWHSREHPR